MKAEDCRACFPREQYRTLFCDIARTARPIDRECRIAPLPNIAGHLGQSAKAAAGTRATRCAEPETLNTLRNGFAVAIHAGHHDDAAVPPVISGREDPAV